MRYGYGVDVGGTTVKLGLFTEQGQLVEKWEIPTNTANDGAAILPDIAEAILGSMKKHGIEPKDVAGAGVGVPGPVKTGGIVNRCINLGWGVLNVSEILGGLLGMPVYVGNDANVAALGECWKGGGRGYDNMVMATLGTGVGGGIVLEGKMVYGAHGAAGEIGHMPEREDEPEACGCGKHGCAEQYGSASGVSRLAKRYLASHEEPSPLRDLEKITAKDVFDQGKAGDPAACAILDEYYRFLGNFLAQICCVVDPEVVVLGGGVCKAGQVLLDGVKKYFVPNMFHTGRGVEFRLAELGNDAGIYGCCKLALDA